RPLKKGVARMVFGAYEHLGHDRLKVIPVGVNYSRPHKFRSKLFYNVGQPLLVKDYIKQYRENPARTMNVFLNDLSIEMKDLVLHIPEPTMDDTVHYAEKLLRNDLIIKQNLPGTLHSEHKASQQIVSMLSKAKTSQVELYQHFSQNADTYFRKLKEYR